MISKISTQLPSKRLENKDLVEEFPEWTEEKIFEKTGIKQRWISAEKEFTSDLARAAGEKILKNIDRKEIDFLLVCTQSPDYLLPTTACSLQDKLQLVQTCGALDFNLGCSGYIYGLGIATSLINSKLAKNVLLITSDTYSKLLAPTDKSTRAIFGDGATATLLNVFNKNKLHSFTFGTDGKGGKNLISKKSGLRGLEENCKMPDLYMNGPEVFNFTIQKVPILIEEILNKSKLQLSDIDRFVFHQANTFMLMHLFKKLCIPINKCSINLEKIGNTVSSTIPMALQQDVEDGKITSGMRIMLVGFGVGYSWGACILDLNMTLNNCD